MYLDEVVRALESRYLLETKWISYLIRNADTFICVLVTIHRFTDGLDGGISEQMVQGNKVKISDVTQSEVVQMMLSLNLPQKLVKLQCAVCIKKRMTEDPQKYLILTHISTSITQVQDKISSKIEEHNFVSRQKMCEDVTQSNDDFFMK